MKTFVHVKIVFSAKVNLPKWWPIFWCDRRRVLASLTQDARVEIPLRLFFFWCDQALTVEGSTFQVSRGLYIYPCFLNTSPTKVLLMPWLLVNMSCPAQHDSEQRLISQSLVKVRKPRFGLEEGCSQCSEQAAVQSKESY